MMYLIYLTYYNNNMNSMVIEWRNELDTLTEKTSITLEDVCVYLGVSYPDTIGFYHKIPKKREMFIGIGMAFGQDIQMINNWIVKYGNKRKLYVKEALSDLIWIYLINCNHRDHAEINYFRLYDKCREAILDTYISLWNEYVTHDRGTASVENELQDVVYDDEFRGLRSFIVENMDAFKTAYSKPRSMISRYVQTILSTYDRANPGKKTPVNFLRGYLDDSMINYITGSPDSINVMDMKSRDRVINSKAVPKLRETHIALCLALGMLTDEIDHYLEMMGYQPLDRSLEDEKDLIEALDKWDSEHPLTRRYKEIHLSEDVQSKKTSGPNNMTVQEELQAVSDMLMLRSDLDYEYRLKRKQFTYLKG